jgi:hypothetical protein
MALKSLLTQAASAARQADRKARHTDCQAGWSDGWHIQASTTDSLRILRDSVTGVAESTAQTATTQEGWWRIARGAGKVAGGAALVACGVAQGILQNTSASEDHEDVPDHLRYGPSSSDPGGSPYSSDPEY